MGLKAKNIDFSHLTSAEESNTTDAMKWGEIVIDLNFPSGTFWPVKP